MCPFGGRWLSGVGPPWVAARMVCHCLLIETTSGLVLVDTGFGTADVAAPERRLGKGFVKVVRPRFDPAETALQQVEALGFARRDVRHIVLTHLDLDHAGGLSDFPEAKVHVHAFEHAAATEPSFRERGRYRKPQWEHGPRWVTYRAHGDHWFGFESVRGLEGVPPEIVLIPLFGHSRGHSGVAVEVEGGWLLHAGDAYFHRDEVHAERASCPPGLELFQSLVQMDGRARRNNRDRLHRLAREQRREVQIFCAHDPIELERMAKGVRPAPRVAAQPAVSRGNGAPARSGSHGHG
jgi:glyoxylase-like metal-dependent hydrolase (beta-lactamase superfamily II)